VHLERPGPAEAALCSFCDVARQREWLLARAESRVPLASAAARDTLRTLVHTDALERFLADNFPATKV
jgi:2-oxoglutarate dehydrogenase complex dehydrogenase (E1) component-like enzyme